MSPSTWQRVKALYSSANELPEGEREAYIHSQSLADPRAATEALRLLRAGQAPARRKVEPIRLPSPGFANPAGTNRLEDGQLLASRYLVRRFVAQGGVGEVYEAEDIERAERVALKIFRAEFASSDHIPWLRREVEMARRVRHPNVCRVFDLVADGGLVFLTMEFLDGETLSSYLRREGAHTERRAFPLIRQMVAGLAAAHGEGVVHRDFKPGNVMIVPRADGPPRAVITDFGMARASSGDRRTTMTVPSTSGFGTPAYMAPEQVAGEPAARQTDVYALGVVLHEMLTGELPFSDESPLAMAVRKTRERPESPRRYAPALRTSWERAVLRCLDPDPRRRFRDVRDVLRQLESRHSRLRIAMRALGQRLPRAAVMAVAALASVTAAAWLLWPRTPSAETVRKWEAGVFALHAGEPLAAIQQWESLDGAVPARAPVDRAIAWHALGFAERARSELAKAPRPEHAYAEAAAAWIGGDVALAKRRSLERARVAPHDGLILADAAAFGNTDSWARVVELKPEHAGAHLRLAESAAANGQWSGADRHFTIASTYFQGSGLASMVRAVSSRRGLARLASGDAAAARADLQPGKAIEGTGSAPCERFVVLTSGRDDNFDAPADPVPYVSDRFPADLLNGARRLFDQGSTDGRILASFPLPNYRFCSGQLAIRMRRGSAQGGTVNDAITIGAAPFGDQSFAPKVQTLWAALSDSAHADIVIELEPGLLASVQRAYAGAPVASLDLVAGDDTDFDFIKLTLVY